MADKKKKKKKKTAGDIGAAYGKKKRYMEELESLEQPGRGKTPRKKRKTLLPGAK